MASSHRGVGDRDDVSVIEHHRRGVTDKRHWCCGIAAVAALDEIVPGHVVCWRNGWRRNDKRYEADVVGQTSKRKGWEVWSKTLGRDRGDEVERLLGRGSIYSCRWREDNRQGRTIVEGE